MRRLGAMAWLLSSLLVISLAYQFGWQRGREGEDLNLVSVARAETAAEAMISPVKARSRDTYFPNSEDLRPDEMRVIACGTGMPTARPSQAAACFLVELGNGDKFKPIYDEINEQYGTNEKPGD